MRAHKRVFERRRPWRWQVGRGRHVADDDPLFDERELEIAAGPDERPSFTSEAAV